MNLIHTPWIPVRRKDTPEDWVSPCQILEMADPVLEIRTLRPDFQGALYQWLIGLLQTCFSPKDHVEWLQRYQNPPSSDELKDALTPFAPAFELIGDGPAFQQDFDLPDGKRKSISTLLIDAPGGKTVEDNLDIFIKRNVAERLCLSCAATALFTLQTNAPAGGKGNRVGLRGGGPLTTLIRPNEPDATLWRKLWLNVLEQGEIPRPDTALDPRVFPWLAPTRVSDKKGGGTTLEDAHPLQHYWGMPRRIRLHCQNRPGACDLCGKQTEIGFDAFRTQNYGVNYEGPWVHPLTPYRFDSKPESVPLPLKGQPGGPGYRHWLGFVLKDESNGDTAARVVRVFMDRRGRALRQGTHARLWCFGYDMDNMKARCWYDSTMPLFQVAPQARKAVMHHIQQLLSAARDGVQLLRKQVKAAWFRRPEDAKADMSMVDRDFWESTEQRFYQLLADLVQTTDFNGAMPAPIAKKWWKTLRGQVEAIFDRWALSGPPEDLDMQRVILARTALMKKFSGARSMKDLKSAFTSAEKQ